MKLNKDNLHLHLITYQLSMIGLTIDDIKENEYWYNENMLSEEQFKEFKKYAIQTIKKVLRCKYNTAERAFDWFNLGYGLKVNKI